MASFIIPKTMRGVQMSGFGGPEVLQYKDDLPVPTLQENQVLVKNDFIGINYVDTYWRMGKMGPVSNGILGREAEGTIVSIGPGNDAGDFKVGDRIVWLSMGAYAEYTAVPVSTAYVIPSNIAPGIAAAAILQGLTALVLTHQVYQVKKGDWVLVHAAAGGVGLWLCQLCKALGAKVVGTASTEAKIKLARENGAEVMINYTEEPDGFVRKIKEITNGHGVDVVYDGIGKDQTENNVNVVADGGTIVTYGASSGFPDPISPTKLAAKNIRFVGPRETSLMRHVGGAPEQWSKWCARLFDTITNDHINVRIHHTYPLSDVVTVHKDLEGRKTTGKVLMKP